MDDFIEMLCREVCELKGIDPDKEGFGFGYTMPKGSTYPLWRAQEAVVRQIVIGSTPSA